MTKKHTLLLAIVACLISTMLPGWAAKPAAPAKKPPAAKGTISEAEWTKRFNDKINLNIGKPVVKTKVETTVLIKIDKDGTLQEVTVDKSSGDEKADEEALNAVKKSAPFGPMPVEYKDGLNLKFTISFRPPENRTDYDPYMNKLRSKIQSVWRAPETKAVCQVTILFVLDKEGKIKSSSIKKPSGYKIVDDTALSAIRKAAPFGPLPNQDVDGYPIEYTLAAGPPGADLKRYQWNGVPLQKAGWQVSRGGATLEPLEVNKTIDRKLEAREWAIKDKLESLKNSVAQTSDPKKKLSMFTEMAQCYSDIHNYDEACKTLTEAATIEKETSPESETYGLILSQLAENHSKTNRLSEAEKEYEESVAILRKNGQNQAKLKEVLTNYAKVLYKMNKAKEAEALYKELRETKVQ